MIDEIMHFALAVFVGTAIFILVVGALNRWLSSAGRDKPKVCRPLKVRRPAQHWEPPTAKRGPTVYPDGREVLEDEAI